MTSPHFFSCPLTASTLAAARQIVLKNEHRAVNLAEIIRCSITDTLFFDARVKTGMLLYAAEKDCPPVGCILITTTGIVLHSFLDITILEKNTAAILDYLKQTPLERLHSIMGVGDHTAILVRLLHDYFGITPTQQETYYLMCREHTGLTLAAPPGITCTRAAEHDLKNLLPLHIAYNKKEVIPIGRHVPPQWFKRSLQTALKTQLVFQARVGKNIAGKAGTNAQGYRWYQIGGVYTVPEYRNRGVCTALVSAIAAAADKHNKNLVLFVKRHNRAAIKSYKKAGFNTCDFFSIVYFRR